MTDTLLKTSASAPSGEDVRTTRAHIFFWTELCAAAAVSVAGNATQAVLHTSSPPVVAAVVAVIPPLALLAAVHGVALLARAHTVSPTAQRAATSLTVVIAGAAFWMSFTALRALAITAGVPAAEAWLWPLIVEGSMTQSTMALLTLAHAGPPRAEPHTRNSNADPPPLNTLQAAPRTPQPLPDPGSASVGSSDADTGDECLDLEVLAAMICAQDPGGRRDRDTVASVLTRRYVDEWSASRVARELGCSRSAVSRILRDAERLRAHPRDDRAHAAAHRAQVDLGRAHAPVEPSGDRAHAEVDRAHVDTSVTG